MKVKISRVPFFTVLALFMSLFFYVNYLEARYWDQSKTSVQAPSSGPILYYRPGCSHCEKVKEYLREKGTSLTMRNASDNNYRPAYRALGISGVPALAVEGQVIVGDSAIIAYLESHPSLLQ